ncbi:MAG: peptidyl-prolyl cis-trans isomerase [Proteobacteria bacterium]|nr:peptidyl-prolyl cis-trans isomerase [Pseudomonadota bacterium]
MAVLPTVVNGRPVPMLKQMREGTKSAVLKLTLFGLLLLAMTGLALMDVQGMFRNGVGGNTVASIGREKLAAIDFDRLVQSALHEQHMKQSDAYRAGFPLQFLKQEIDSRLFMMAANELGIQVGDEVAAKQVKAMLAPLVEKGLSEKEALQRVLQSYRLSEGQFVSMLKSQMASQQLLGIIASGAHAPKQLVDASLAYRNEWRRGDYFTLTADDLEAAKTPSEEELKAFYTAVAREYALPEYRTLSVITLDKKSVGDEVTISNDKLRQVYEENISDYKTPETRVISQVVAADEKTALQIHDAAMITKDLQKAAAAGKGNYIKSVAMTEADMLAELSKAAFASPAGQVLAPIKTPLGWHVVYVEKITPGVTKSFESVKAVIEKDLLQDKVATALYERANKIDDEIGGGKTLSEVAKENGLRITVLEKIDAHGMGQNGKKSSAMLPLFDKILETGFGLHKGAASPLIETPDGAFMIVSADDIVPSEQQSFDKVRAQILARWKTDRHVKALSAKSAQIMDRLKQGEPFDKIAAGFKKSVQATALVKRATPDASTKANDHLIEALFSIDKVGHATAVGGDNSVTLIRLAERKVTPLKDINKTEVNTVEALLNRTLKQDLLEQYRLSLMDKYDVTVNGRLMSEMYAPKEDTGGNGDE